MSNVNTKKLDILNNKYWWLKIVAVTVVLSIVTFLIDPYLAYVATSWIIFGLLGLSLDLVWGRAGILSLGQTAFYGMGGYVSGIAAINLIDLTNNPFLLSLPMGAIAGAFIAFLIGALMFYGRMGELQTTILTYTFTLILWTVSVSYTTKIGKAVVGGDNGMSNIPEIALKFSDKGEALTQNQAMLIVLLIAAIVYLLVKVFIRSPFGLIVDCIRQDPLKAELLGYDIRRFQLIIFVISGAIAGLAGSLYVGWSNYINPAIFSVQEALLVPMYVLVGGLGTLCGAFIGAFAVGGLSYWLGGGVIGGQTTLIMGAALILLVVFLKNGLLGGLGMLWKRMKGKDEQDQESKKSHSGVSLEKLNLKRANKNREIISEDMNVSLKSDHAVKQFGGVIPVNDISQSFKPGQVRCLIGPNGAGKSSFLKCFIGINILDKGKIFLGDLEITSWDPFARVNAGIGIKMQAPQVFHECSIKENLWLAAYSKSRNKKSATKVSNEMIYALNMNGREEERASDLSHGEQQWLDIAMVLSLEPTVVLLDEPAAGMSRDESNQLSKLICELAKDISVIVVDHDMHFIRELEADVTVLHKGEVFANGTIEELRQDERILDIYLGRRKNVRAT